jgi:hypothetical protein
MPCCAVGCLLLQALQYLPLVWLVASVVYCYDSTLPQPMLAADGTPLASSSKAARDSKKAS